MRLIDVYAEPITGPVVRFMHGLTIARLAEVWAEYDELTRAEWHCDRATALRSQIRRLLGGDR